MNKRQILLLIFLVIGFTGCQKHWEYVQNIPYQRIYLPNSIETQIGYDNVGLIPVCNGYDESQDAESRAFYNTLDTSLFFSGRLKKTPAHLKYMDFWCAIDLRISTIEIITTEDYDDEHPAGSLLNDLCQIWYTYKHCKVARPLTDIKYGALMLTDYYPLNPDADGAALPINIHLRSAQVPDLKVYPDSEVNKYDDYKDFQPFPKIEVRISDAFGREFVARTEDND